jgi:hypothetical protein
MRVYLATALKHGVNEITNTWDRHLDVTLAGGNATWRFAEWSRREPSDMNAKLEE